MQDVMQEATSLIIEGALVCFTQTGRSAFTRFFSTSPLEFEGALSNIRQKLNGMYIKINTEIALRGLTLIEHQGRSPLSKEYPTRAGNGQVEKDLLLTVEEDVPELEDEDIPELEDEDMPELEDAYMPELEEAYIHTPQVEEDLPEPQKAYIRFVCLIIIVLNPNIQLKNHFNGQVDEDLLSTECQKVFKMEAFVAATKNFHEDNKVGEGGFGAVYKGTHDGKQIAVKKMSFTDERSREDMKKQFKNEKLLAEFQHRNIVNLLGSCEQESQGFLVYEYLPNGSLDKFLFDPENRKLLDWHKRDNIIQGIAQGLQYLHEDSRVRIVHRDIKASNILLDEKLNPKIADFGTANLFPEDRTHVTATSAAGTFGYMALEYFMTREFTVKTDVYSFGIVLLELLTGEKISSNALESLGRVWRLYNRKEALQTIDPTIIETSDKEAAKALRCIQIGFLCIQHDRRRRPTMSQVIVMLSTDQSLPDPENPPCLPSYCATQENGNSAMEKLMFNSE